METILAYCQHKYRPLSLILYGSYAEGTQGEGSDFDALLIVPNGQEDHDTAEVDGVRLDVWIYPADYFERDFDPETVVQIHGGLILSDTDGIGRCVMDAVARYVAALPVPTFDEIRESLTWCRKMLARAARTDAEGLYRHHWLLTDSLQIAADVLGFHHFGPKKTLRRLREMHPDLYAIYIEALRENHISVTERWIAALESYVIPT